MTRDSQEPLGTVSVFTNSGFTWLGRTLYCESQELTELLLSFKKSTATEEERGSGRLNNLFKVNALS